MVESTSTQPVDQDVKFVTGLRVLQAVLFLFGVILVVLSVVIPIWMGAMIRGGGENVAIRFDYLRALTPFITIVSLVSSFVVAVVIVSFEKSRANVASVLFGILTLSVFIAEISLSIYLSLIRPLSGTADPIGNLRVDWASDFWVGVYNVHPGLDHICPGALIRSLYIS